MVINHKNIEGERDALRQRAAHCIRNGGDAIAHGDDDARGHRKRRVRCGHSGKVWLQVGPNTLQMRRRNRFHFYLVVALVGGDVIEDTLPAGTHIEHRTRIQRFRNAHDWCPTRQLQAQIVQAAPAPCRGNGPMIAYGTLYSVSGDEDDRAEIEGVADAPSLVIDEWVLNRFSRTLFAEVTVEQPRTGILRQVHEALERLLSELDATAGQYKQEVVLRPGLQQALHSGAR